MSRFRDDRLLHLVEALPDAIVLADTAANIVFANRMVESIFGHSSAELIGRPFAMLLADAERESHGHPLRCIGVDASSGVAATNVANESAPVRVELEGMRKDGGRFCLEHRVSAIATDDGVVSISVLADITARRESERASARTASGLRQAQQLARLGHIVTGPGGVFEDWSDTLPALVGLPDDGLPRTTREWMAYIHPEDRARFRACCIEAGRTGNREEIEYRFRRGEQWAHVRQLLMPLADERAPDTPPTRWFNTLQDISEQKSAELRIRMQNRMLRMLNAINALIARANDIDELLQEACRIAVSEGGFLLAWIGLVDAGERSMRLAAGYGGPESFYTALRKHLLAVPLTGHGRIARILRHLQPEIVQDIAASPMALEHALLAGSRSLCAFPLTVEGRGVGMISMHMPRPGCFDDAEVELLRDLAGDISFALDHLEKSNRLRYLANHDALTGLPNRAMFSDRLGEALRARDARDAIFAVVLIDLERMRYVNDTLGRAAGDELLKQVGARLRAANPSAARVGADVFAFTIADKRSARDIARATEEHAALCFDASFVLGAQELRMSCRAGVAVYPLDGENAEMLLGNAEAALRKAKASAEQFVFYGRELNARAAQALNLEGRLRRALERNEFVLHYQPKVAFGDWRICGVEALLRWQDPERGLVAPAEFIGALEESGLIRAAGEWALHHALADQQRWRAAGLGTPRVAVNVSPLQLRGPDFRSLVIAALRGAPDAALELEITESTIMEDIDRNSMTLKQLRSAGVTIAIDDFGTGYCSLTYIAKLPVTSLKIDRSFIIAMTERPEGLAIVSSIIALAHALKLTVVAEGVEDAEQARLLHLLGCDSAQGFLFSRPLTADRLEPILRAGRLPPPKPRLAEDKTLARRLSAAK